MALDFVAGCLGGCAGIVVGQPFDCVKVHLQTQDYKNPKYNGTYDCIKKIIKSESITGLYRGMSSPMAGIAFVNAIVFGVYGNVQRNTSDPNSLFSHFLAGSAAGAAQSVICSPMELIKTRLQIQNDYPIAIKHKSPLDCLRHIYNTEGIRGVFKGFGITITRDIPGFASYFVAYELLNRQTSNPNAFFTLMAGGIAGTFSWLITFPIDVVKSRLQADGIGSVRQYNGVVDCINKSYKSEGVNFLTRGLASTLLRAFPMNAVCFLVVANVLKLCEKTNINVNVSPNIENLQLVDTYTSNHHFMMKLQKEKDLNQKLHENKIKEKALKYMMYLSGFQEAICCSEVKELADDIYGDTEYFYRIEDVRFCRECFENKEPSNCD